MEGWIKLHRKLVDWEWYHDSKMVHLLFHLIAIANHKEGKWKGIEIKRGQLITGLDVLKQQTGISTQSLRTCLERLKSTGEITNKSTNKYRVITILKYDSYQINENTNKQTNKQLTNKQQTTNKQLTANKNVKKDNNENKEEVYRFFDHLSISVIDYQKLLDLGWNKKQIDLTLDSIQNYSKNKNYKNLYLTSKKWLEKEPKASEVKNKFASPII
jgi:hypothetical protein